MYTISICDGETFENLTALYQSNICMYTSSDADIVHISAETNFLIAI